MRMLIFVLALVCASTPCRAIEFVACPKMVPFFGKVKKHTDSRVRAILTELIIRAGLSDRRFAFCESEEFSPAMFPADKVGGTVFAVILPRTIGSLSDSALKGLIAHELGHVAFPNLWGGKSIEVRVDLVAGQWVSTEAIVESIHEMQKHLKRFPLWQQDLGRVVFNYRLDALVQGLYEEN